MSDSLHLLPPSGWADANDWEFSAFLVQTEKRRCLTCGSIHRSVDTYRIFTSKGRLAGTMRRNTEMVGSIPPGTDLVVASMPEREVPVCDQCLARVQEAAGTGQVAEYRLIADASWREALAAKGRPIPTAERPTNYTPVAEKRAEALKDFFASLPKKATR